ncbi:MAG TPA: AAA family ATPase, partial [Ktedonobacterales bacterium]|nr:AAA family ATPase [Ktedonobacterales bacterium]
MVGRARQIAALDRHLSGDGPPVLLVSGEPGIGKSRLLRQAAVSAAERGLAVLWGNGHRLSAHEPFSPIVEALAGYLQRQSPTMLRGKLEGCDWLVRLLPELAGSDVVAVPPSAPAPDQERRLMFRAVERFLSHIAADAGTLLVLDDLQWAGGDALELLIALARVAGEIRLRLAVGYRSTERQKQRPLTALAELARAGLTAHLALGPLVADDARELLGHLLPAAAPPALADSIVRRTGGVPFYLISCARGVEAASLSPSDDHEVPWDVMLSIRQQVAALPSAPQAALGAAVVAGRSIPWPTLRALGARLGQDEATLSDALDAANQAGLLAPDGPDALQFAHDLVRDAIESDLGPARRATLHRWVAEVLEQSPGEPPSEQLAYQYVRAGNRERAIPYLERAGDRAL